MPNKVRKVKPITQAGPVKSCRSTLFKVNKEKAKTGRNSQRLSPNTKEACADTVRKDADPVKSPAGSPSRSHSSPDAEEPCPNAASGNVEAPTPSAEKSCPETTSGDISTPKADGPLCSDAAHPPVATTEETTKTETFRGEKPLVLNKIKEVEYGKTGGEFVSLEEAQSEKGVRLALFGHVQTKDGGTPTTAIIGLERRGRHYIIAFTAPRGNGNPTTAHKYMDHYIRQEYSAIVELLIPLLGSVFEEADNKPVLEDNFEAFLDASETYLRLVPDTATGTLKPYPEFARSQGVNWDSVMQKASPTCPMWKLSDVKHFRPHSNTNMIYEVDLGDNNDFNCVIFKRVDDEGLLQQEYRTLLHCGRVGIRAPRVLGLLGVGTKWGGFVMIKISASFCLRDCHPESIKATSIQPALADRKRWFEQISDAIHTLHRDGYVWGDVKPANVLINQDGDACLIDFEGGWSPGWVDDELADSEEGDLQGLQRLRDFLKLDE
ncbi:hypothetical protein BJX68DRAFT_261708 [Aspergillus pseudodeflectus]|uniref:Protein kinase domain-containing protein n=1 Tax=Aspergillus pseudodeflectus TaxID=176178 RepID=A0ABR4L3X8_9EURO